MINSGFREWDQTDGEMGERGGSSLRMTGMGGVVMWSPPPGVFSFFGSPPAGCLQGVWVHSASSKHLWITNKQIAIESGSSGALRGGKSAHSADFVSSP